MIEENYREKLRDKHHEQTNKVKLVRETKIKNSMTCTIDLEVRNHSYLNRHTTIYRIIL